MVQLPCFLRFRFSVLIVRFSFDPNRPFAQPYHQYAKHGLIKDWYCWEECSLKQISQKSNYLLWARNNETPNFYIVPAEQWVLASDLEGIGYRSCKTQHFKRSFPGEGFHGKGARVTDPEVGERDLPWKPRCIDSDQNKNREGRNQQRGSEASKPTVVLVNKPLPRILWEHTMGDICTHLCCTLGCQDFLTMKRERTMSEQSMISQKLKASTV